MEILLTAIPAIINIIIIIKNAIVMDASGWAD